MDRRSRTFRSALKTCLFVGLTAVTLNVYAGWFDSPTVYVGNPHRPNTTWQPTCCRGCGCWNEGFYIKFLRQPRCGDACWVNGRYDRVGNWIPPHYVVKRFRVVNPMPDSYYPGYAM